MDGGRDRRTGRGRKSATRLHRQRGETSAHREMRTEIKGIRKERMRSARIAAQQSAGHRGICAARLSRVGGQPGERRRETETGGKINLHKLVLFV
jgi:hypothetical protein